MIKSKEASDPKSCWNKATDNQLVFVLHDGDPAMIGTIRAWINERVRLGINKRDDPKILEAQKVIVALETKAPLEDPAPASGLSR